MRYVARPIPPKGGPGIWEPIQNESEILPEHHFITLCDIDPTGGVEERRGIIQPKKLVAHHYLGPLGLDIDTSKEKGLVTVENVRTKLLTIMEMFKSRYNLDPRSHGIRYFFSGKKGYHVEISEKLFGIHEHVKALPYLYRRIVEKMNIAPFLDMAIYNIGLGRMWRLPGRARMGSDRPMYKIPLTYDDIVNRSSDDHRVMAERPCEFIPNGVGLESIPELVELLASIQKEEAELQTEGTSKKEFQKLRPENFELSDCVKKILTHDESVNSAKNFHHISFVLSLFAQHSGWSWEKTEAIYSEFLSSEASQTYSSYDERLEHLKSNYYQITSGDYKFNCHVMRNIVPKPECYLCPLNAQPDESTLEDTLGVLERNGRYYHVKWNSKEQKFMETQLSLGTIEPETRALSTIDDPQTYVQCHIKFPEGYKTASFKLDLNAFTETPAVLMKEVQQSIGTGYKYALSIFSTSGRQYQGIRGLVQAKMRNLPHYKSAGVSQGAHKFKGKWYWCDYHGCRRGADWSKSNNVRLDKVSAVRMNMYPKQELTQFEALDPKSGSDMRVAYEWFNLIAKFQPSSVISPMMGWCAASFYRQRLYELKNAGTVPGIDAMPIMYHFAQAESGKSQLDQVVLKRLFGYTHDELQCGSLTMFIIMSEIVPGLNSTPVLLDEFKKQKSNDRRLKLSDINAIARTVWQGGTMSRGTADLSSKEYEFKSAFKVAGPVLSDEMDAATRHRGFFVKSSTEGVTKNPQYRRAYDQYKKKYLTTDTPGRIGATMAWNALRIKDRKILALLEEAYLLASKRLAGFPSRRIEGVAKILFGHKIMEFTFGPKVWDADYHIKETITTILGDAYITESGKVGDRMDNTDWVEVVKEFIKFTYNTTVQGVKLTDGRDYWFEAPHPKKNGGRWTMVMNIGRAFESKDLMERRTNHLGVSMDEDGLISSAYTSRVLIPFGEDRGMPIKQKGSIRPPASDVIQPGTWVMLDVEKLMESNVSFEGIKGAAHACTGTKRIREAQVEKERAKLEKLDEFE